MPINASAFYQVVMQGRYHNQNIFNILHYRIGTDFIPGPLNFGGAEEVATEVKRVVWDGGLKAVMSSSYLLDKIAVYPRNDTFIPITTLPYVHEVGEYGQETDGSSGSASVMIARFNIEPTGLENGWFPPKRGYIALGPVPDSKIDENGNIEGADYAALNTAVQVLASNLEGSLFDWESYYPIRVSTRKVAGVLTLRGWADVSSVSLRHKTSYRRSRVGEA